MNRAVFFDRDGVLNNLVFRDGKYYSPRNINKFKKVSNLYYDNYGIDARILEGNLALSVLLENEQTIRPFEIKRLYNNRSSNVFMQPFLWKQPKEIITHMSHYIFYCHCLKKNDEIFNCFRIINCFKKDNGWYHGDE